MRSLPLRHGRPPRRLRCRKRAQDEQAANAMLLAAHGPDHRAQCHSSLPDRDDQLVRLVVGRLGAPPLDLQPGEARERLAQQPLRGGQPLRHRGGHAPHLPARVRRQHGILGVGKREALKGVEQRQTHGRFLGDEVVRIHAIKAHAVGAAVYRPFTFRCHRVFLIWLHPGHCLLMHSHPGTAVFSRTVGWPSNCVMRRHLSLLPLRHNNSRPP
ncbi:MAG: hypothetical protein AB7G75_06335 [Candidatus Binatia bacterium]